MGAELRSDAPVALAKLPAVGSTVAGRYELGKLFARGAMGVVYEAVDLTDGKDLALKILPPMALKEQSRDRFLREMRLTAAIEHPHVVKTYQAGLIDNILPYIAMERLVGETLAQRLLKTDVVPVKGVLKILCEVLPALQAAHDQNVLHRDIKPANIFLEKRGAVLFDFGLSIDRSQSTRMTGPGIAIGTPGYMAPEQVLGSDVDERTDLYSVAATAYEAIAGVRPVAHRETKVHKVFEAIVSELPKPPSRRQADVPPQVDALLLTALAKDPADRFADAAQMHAACERVFASLV